MFETNGNADQTGCNAHCLLLRRREFGMGGRGWVSCNGTAIAKVICHRDHFQCIQECTAAIEAAFDIEGEDTTAIFHLLFCDRILRMIFQERVFYPAKPGMALQSFRKMK